MDSVPPPSPDGGGDVPSDTPTGEVLSGEVHSEQVPSEQVPPKHKTSDGQVLSDPASSGQDPAPNGPTPPYAQRPPYGQAPPYGQQPPYGQAPPYGQQPPYGQPPYGQPPYGQAQYGQAPYGYGAQNRVEHPQGTTILVLGILGLVVCGILGIVAWSMGNKARDEMAAQPGVSFTNEGMITAGRICGMISTIIMVISIGFIVVVFAGVLSSGVS
jgi:hypothetical protein